MKRLVIFILALSFSSMSQAYLLGPTSPGKWGDSTMGTGASITWSLMDTGTSCALESAGCTISALGDFMPGGYKSELERAFDAWSDVANLIFTEVSDSGEVVGVSGTSGDIRIGGHIFDGPNGTLAHGYYPPANGNTFAGDIHFDTAETWALDFPDSGFDIFQVFVHELGHALGLDHTTVPASLMNPIYSEAFSGPQADDIAGMQFIYGANTIPVPGTLILFLAGLMGFGFVKSKKSKIK